MHCAIKYLRKLDTIYPVATSSSRCESRNFDHHGVISSALVSPAGEFCSAIHIFVPIYPCIFHSRTVEKTSQHWSHAIRPHLLRIHLLIMMTSIRSTAVIYKFQSLSLDDGQPTGQKGLQTSISMRLCIGCWHLDLIYNIYNKSAQQSPAKLQLALGTHSKAQDKVVNMFILRCLASSHKVKQWLYDKANFLCRPT